MTARRRGAVDTGATILGATAGAIGRLVAPRIIRGASIESDELPFNVGDEPLTVCLTILDRQGSRETGRGAIALAASGDGAPRPREGTMLLVHIAVDALRIRMT